MKKNGFTLVEVLIVVAIVGLLAAIAIPNYVKHKEGLASAKSAQQGQTFNGVVDLPQGQKVIAVQGGCSSPRYTILTRGFRPGETSETYTFSELYQSGSEITWAVRIVEH